MTGSTSSWMPSSNPLLSALCSRSLAQCDCERVWTNVLKQDQMSYRQAGAESGQSAAKATTAVIEACS